eukprot:767696-Karenia_brevis.AAC.1
MFFISRVYSRISWRLRHANRGDRGYFFGGSYSSKLRILRDPTAASCGDRDFSGGSYSSKLRIPCFSGGSYGSTLRIP